MLYGEDFATYRERLIEGAASIKSMMLGAEGKYKDFTPGKNSILNKPSLMIDIETGGLSRNAPILQLGMVDSSGLKQELNMMPVSITRDTSTIDPLTGNVREPTYKYSAKAILSPDEFREKFGDWAFNKKFGLEALYANLDKVPANMRKKLEADMLIKDTIDLAEYTAGSVQVKYNTPRHMTKVLLNELTSLQKQQGNLMAANMPFESARLGDTLAYYLDPENPNNIIDEANMDADKLRSMFDASYKYTGKNNILDPNNLDYRQGLRRLEATDGNISKLIELWPKFNQKTGTNIATVDIQEIGRMLFSGVNQLSYGIAKPGAKDLYSGASVDFATQLLFGEIEDHTALKDAKHQQRIFDITADSVNKVYNLYRGSQKDASIYAQLRGTLSGIAGLFDMDFQKALNYAESRFKTGTIEDSLLGYKYHGAAYNMLKKRGVHRSLSLMHHTLDAYESYVKGGTHDGPISLQYAKDADGNLITTSTGQRFTVTSDTYSTQDWVDDTGQEFKEFKKWSTNKHLPEDTIALYRKTLQESGPEAARKAIESHTLAQYHKSQAISSSDLDMSLQDLEAEYRNLKPRLGKKEVFKSLTEGDSEFKQKIIGISKSHTAESSQYMKFFVRTYGKQLAALGAATAVIAGVGKAGMDALLTDDAKVSIEDEGLSLSKAAKMKPVDVVNQDPQAFISLMRFNKDFRERAEKDIEKRNQEHLKTLGSLRSSDFKGTSAFIVNDRSMGKTTPMKEIDLSRFKVEVEDADTLLLKRPFKKDIVVRMAGIDAPETTHTDSYSSYKKKTSMPGGLAATARLKEMISQGDLKIAVQDGEKTYGRYIGAIFSKGENLNLKLVEEGMAAALAYGPQKGSLESQKVFREAEQSAFANKLGMWKQPYYNDFYYNRNRPTFNSVFSYDRIASNRRYAAMSFEMESAGVVEDSPQSRERKYYMAEMQNEAMMGIMSNNPGRSNMRSI